MTEIKHRDMRSSSELIAQTLSDLYRQANVRLNIRLIVSEWIEISSGCKFQLAVSKDSYASCVSCASPVATL